MAGRWLTCHLALLSLTACAPSARLTFPQSPVESTPTRLAYDTDGDGRADFALLAAAPNLPRRILQYDDDGDGRPDRIYDMDAYDDAMIPHVVILIDSIPYGAVAERFAQGGFSFFDPPRKVIAPFPTMSGLIFTRILHAPPLPGVNNQYFDPRLGEGGAVRDMIRGRAFGYVNPWQQHLDYHAGYIDNGLAFLHPRPWFAAELERVRHAIDDDDDRTTIAYIASSSGMLSARGREGLAETLDGLEQLCTQLLYERQGALDITILSDHGHNLIAGEHFDLPAALRQAGFDVGGRLRDNNDVVLDLDGLVNYAGIHTRTPAAVAEALAPIEQIQLLMYLDQDAVVIRSAAGACRIRAAAGGDRFAVELVDGADPLGYAPIIDELRASGIMDEHSFAPDRAWFDATVDHEYPDAPRRAWDAFHGSVVNPPALMAVIRDGWYVGDKSFERYITMQSTHGGFNQQHSAAFVLTTTGRLHGPLRSRDVLPAVMGAAAGPPGTLP
jgi:hypothetical protein